MAATDAAATTFDLTLLERINRGDRSALAELYDRHAARVFGVAIHVTQDPALAEVVVEQTFVRISRCARGPGVATPEPGAWIQAIVVQLAQMALRIDPTSLAIERRSATSRRDLPRRDRVVVLEPQRAS